MSGSFRVLIALLVHGLCLPALLSADDYKSFNAAMAAGGAHLRDRNFAASQAPFEAALKLAKDDSQRMQAYEALRPAYRQLPEIAKMTEAYEFIAAHADSTARRSNAATDFASFVHQRGKSDGVAEEYEKRLKENPDDLPALSLLATLYQRSRSDKKDRGNELAARLKRLNSERAVAKAEGLERDAEDEALKPVAEDKVSLAAWTWKNAAQAWVDAGDLPRAKKAAERSVAAPGETRTQILTLQWREGLGDVFTAAGDHVAAAREYRHAMGVAPAGILKKNVEEKLAKAETASKAAPAN